MAPPVEGERAQRLVAIIGQSEAKLDKVARVLHDEIGQILSAVGLQLGVLRLDLQSQAPEIAPRTAEIQKFLENVVVRIRELSNELNPSVVERAGLQPAIEGLVQRLQKDFPGALHLKYEASLGVPRERARGLFKVAECALANAVTHSRASRIDINVRGKADQVLLEVQDNGCGFDSQKVRAGGSGIGLLLMECYALAAGIKLIIDTAPGKGTMISASFTELN
ncbi:MAG TPA: ATP-binding protein [Bryobacteraceae bacterium]|nr:ATP-binding protein [Bryobacteraceae bacterium]